MNTANNDTTTTLDLDDGVVVVLHPSRSVEESSNSTADIEEQELPKQALHQEDDGSCNLHCDSTTATEDTSPSRNPILRAIQYLKFDGLKMAQGYNIVRTSILTTRFIFIFRVICSF